MVLVFSRNFAASSDIGAKPHKKLIDMEGTEKIYCTDRCGSDAMAFLAGMNGNRGCDPMAMAAMMNGGMGNGMWNNPFVYLVWMMFAGRFFNGNGWDCQGGNPAIQAQLDSLRNQMSDNQNSGLIMDAIKGNATAIGQLAGNLNCDFNQLQNAICCVKSAFEQVSGQVGYTSERVINAVNMGDCNIIQAIKDCCCTTQKSILEMGYQNQLQNCQQTNTIMGGINTVNTGLERGFSNVAYETQRQTCDIINAGNANTQRIIDTLNCHWTQELQQKYQDARMELSQQKQSAYLIEQLKATTATA